MSTSGYRVKRRSELCCGDSRKKVNMYICVCFWVGMFIPVEERVENLQRPEDNIPWNQSDKLVE